MCKSCADDPPIRIGKHTVEDAVCLSVSNTTSRHSPRRAHLRGEDVRPLGVIYGLGLVSLAALILRYQLGRTRSDETTRVVPPPRSLYRHASWSRSILVVPARTEHSANGLGNHAFFIRSDHGHCDRASRRRNRALARCVSALLELHAEKAEPVANASANLRLPQSVLAATRVAPARSLIC